MKKLIGLLVLTAAVLSLQAGEEKESAATKLAKAINARMAAADPALRNEGVLHANFAVTRNPEIPSCLIEADYVTHPDGEAAVWDASRRPSIAAAIADGVADWVAGK